jgi:sec-independent protein translocase protein TatC
MQDTSLHDVHRPRQSSRQRERAELPGMSLFEHLDELRKRIHSSASSMPQSTWSAATDRGDLRAALYEIVQAPLNAIHIQLNFTHPADLVNLRYIQIPLVGGTILAAPFILFQVWLFISPGLYQREKRFVVPFMSAAIRLFFTGAFLGYHYVFPGMLQVPHHRPERATGHSSHHQHRGVHQLLHLADSGHGRSL